MASRDFRRGTEVAFYGRSTIDSILILFFCITPFFFFVQSQKKGGNHVKEVHLVTMGDFDLSRLTEEEERALLRCLLKAYVSLSKAE